MNLSEPELVCGRFAGVARPASIEELGNHGGFSGARLWRLRTELGTLCLRAWPPEYPNQRQLTWVHAVLFHVGARGIDFVPCPMRTPDGSSFVKHAGSLWELTPWMPGRADYLAGPSRVRLRAAMRALARFHLAAESFQKPSAPTPSPTLARRFRELRAFLKGRAAEVLRARIPDGRWPEMDARAAALLRHVDSHAATLDALLERPLPRVLQQPVIRDVWHDHVLFDGARVSGLVDFGTMANDTVAIDVARLLGSLIDGDAAAWPEGLAAYEELRPLSPELRDLIGTIDVTGIFSGGLVWLRWHYLERRSFESRGGVLARVDHFLRRLAGLEPDGTRTGPLVVELPPRL